MPNCFLDKYTRIHQNKKAASVFCIAACG
ncbi:MAG: zinc-finger domain-containing protein [Chloroflexi bacterium]|nr:zinc-finger domain-containing protein [Chloroflexota bacterium]